MEGTRAETADPAATGRPPRPAPGRRSEADATGLTVSGGLGLVAGDQAPAGRIDFPANCDASPGGPGPSEARAGARVRLLPPKGAARGSKFSVTFGAFWGASVEYWYEVVGP